MRYLLLAAALAACTGSKDHDRKEAHAASQPPAPKPGEPAKPATPGQPAPVERPTGPLLEPAAADRVATPAEAAVAKNKWFPFGGTWFRLWGTAFTGSQPKGVSLSADGSRIFVTNTGYHDKKNVDRFDPATLKVVAEANFPGNAVESLVSPKGDVIWVSNFYHKEMLELSTDDLRVTRRFTVEDVPKHFAVSPDVKRLWVANWEKGTVSVVDIASGKQSESIPVGKEPRGTVVTHDGKKVYVTNFGSDSISVIDAAARKVLTTIETPDCNAPRHADVADDERVFVSCYGGKEVIVIDSKTDKVIKKVTVGLGPKTIAISRDQRFAYTADYKGHGFSIIDLSNWKVLVVPLPTYKTSGLAVSPDDSRIYLTGWSARNLMVIDRLQPGAKPDAPLGPQGWGKVCRQPKLTDCTEKFP
ncbi:MAG TPA: hypothetical protein VL172_09485 [Kofleriaceae bacterium]|nr:hypothetical protein [Kofleriaceae bacterium]